MKRFLQLGAAALILALVPPAQAAQVATPLLQALGAGLNLACVITNVGTSDVAIKSLKFYSALGGEVATIDNNCGATLAPKATCRAYFPGPNGHCEVNASGKFRATLLISNATGDSVVVAPATK